MSMNVILGASIGLMLRPDCLDIMVLMVYVGVHVGGHIYVTDAVCVLVFSKCFRAGYFTFSQLKFKVNKCINL